MAPPKENTHVSGQEGAQGRGSVSHHNDNICNYAASAWQNQLESAELTCQLQPYMAWHWRYSETEFAQRPARSVMQWGNFPPHSLSVCYHASGHFVIGLFCSGISNRDILVKREVSRLVRYASQFQQLERVQYINSRQMAKEVVTKHALRHVDWGSPGMDL